jgi:hypothetical protein
MKEEPKLTIPEFHANPTPHEIMEPKFSDILQQERKRKKRIIERAETLLKKSSMPPRMEHHASASKIDATDSVPTKKKSPTGGFSFSPKINPEVPDFAKLQQEFDDLLEKKRKSFSVTR